MKMEKIGIMIRKWDYTEKGKPINPSKKNLKRQVLTLLQKLKKGDKVWMEYSIEKNKNGKGYHIHLILHYTDKENLYQHLSRYIGNCEWKKREIGLDVFDECSGKYGLIHTGTKPVIDDQKYREYINKEDLTTSLV